MTEKESRNFLKKEEREIPMRKSFPDTNITQPLRLNKITL